MVIELNGRRHGKAEFSYSAPEGGHSNFVFCSASSPDDAALEVELNGELVDKVYLGVPHSWWPPTQALGNNVYKPEDVLTFRAVGGIVAIRLDLDEFAPETE